MSFFIRWAVRLIICIYPVFGSQAIASGSVSYTVNIQQSDVNFTGKDIPAITLNNSIPGPILEADVGDIFRVKFINHMDVETSIHWHGVLLPNDQDGVPYLTTQPIAPHSEFTYEFPITHHGTYWHHSHTGLQEQRGVYGALVFHPEQELMESDHDQVLVFSDWTDENPNHVLRNLKRDDDYYSLKKDKVQSWDQILSYGLAAVKNRVNSSLMRMGPMDLSDVGYDAFLVNGQRQIEFEDIKSVESIPCQQKGVEKTPEEYKIMFKEFQSEIFADDFEINYPDYDVAAKYAYVLTQVFSGSKPETSNYIDLKGKYKSKYLTFRDKLKNDKWLTKFDKINVVENMDFQELINKYDGDNSYFYLDPPYWKTENYYSNHDFDRDDHERLAKLLTNMKGKFSLSYYEFELLSEWFPKNDYLWEQKDFVKSAAAKKGKTQNKGTELLILNYNS